MAESAALTGGGSVVATDQITEYRPMSQEQRDAIYAQILGTLGDDDAVSHTSSTPALRSTLRTWMLVAGVILPPVLTLVPVFFWGHGTWLLQIVAGAIAGACFVLLQKPISNDQQRIEIR
jgi:hypothetical protein